MGGDEVQQPWKGGMDVTYKYGNSFLEDGWYSKSHLFMYYFIMYRNPQKSYNLFNLCTPVATVRRVPRLNLSRQ